ncbi:MAG: hypothetical protein ACTSRZ_04455 [Promethearchaeota archaeon]
MKDNRIINIKKQKEKLREFIKLKRIKIFQNNKDLYRDLSISIINNIEKSKLYNQSRSIGFFAPKTANFEPNINTFLFL